MIELLIFLSLTLFFAIAVFGLGLSIFAFFSILYRLTKKPKLREPLYGIVEEEEEIKEEEEKPNFLAEYNLESLGIPSSVVQDMRDEEAEENDV